MGKFFFPIAITTPAHLKLQCWINIKYPRLRLWGHYFWIFVAEFGTIILYGALFWIIRRRIKKNHFRYPLKTAKAQRAACMMVVYPLVYVVCTLPLASARLQSIVGAETSMEHLCLAGAMIACTGWLDVFLFCLTRDVFVPSSGAPNNNNDVVDEGDEEAAAAAQAEADLIDTFQSSFPFWKNRQLFGTTTIIEAGAGAGFRRSIIIRQDSTELLTPPPAPPPRAVLAVKTETTVIVRSDPMELDDIAGITYARGRMRGDSAGEKDDSLSSASLGSGSKRMHDDFP